MKKIYILLICLILFTSCSVKNNQVDLSYSSSSYKMLDVLIKKNIGISPKKGIAYITTSEKRKQLSSRAAFISNSVNAFRIDFLSPTGLPFMTFSYNNKKGYIKNNDKVKIYSNPEKILKLITNIEIPAEFISILICNGVPIIDFQTADTDESGSKLILKNNKEKAVYSQQSNGFEITYENKNTHSKIFIFIKSNHFKIQSSDYSLEFTHEFIQPLQKISDNKIFILTR